MSASQKNPQIIGYIELSEQAVPASLPPLDKCRIFAVDNGSGKTVLKVQFSSGAVQVISTQP